jgi:hypothetical protein
MLQIMIARAQLSTGMSFQLLASPEPLVPHLECEWGQSIRTGLANIQHIAKGKGPAFGADPRSFRAERYGMASAALLYLRLLQRQMEFTQGPRAINKLICNNQGLLIRIAKASDWNYTTPNVALRAEWDIKSVILRDIKSVILTLHKELNVQFKFVHIKSHQDNNTPVVRLSLELRLNVEADLLVTKYMLEDQARRPTVLLLPSAKAQLIINMDSFIWKIPLAIQYVAGSIHIRPYPMRRTWSRTLVTPTTPLLSCQTVPLPSPNWQESRRS